MENRSSDSYRSEMHQNSSYCTSLSPDAFVKRQLSTEVKETPLFFPFPFPPYDIQEDFMTKLYCVLEKGGVGIFESPTGTVKM